MKKLRKVIASGLAVLMLFQITSISLKPKEIIAGDAAGSSQGVSFGRSSNGNVQVSDDTLLRVAGFMEEGKQWFAGYSEIYPANGSFAVMLGSGGNGFTSRRSR